MKFGDNNRKSQEEPEINFIPLIDVLLVILIFLMITTTYSRYAELQINLPTGVEVDSEAQRPQQITLGITAGGKYMINGHSIAFVDVSGLSRDLRASAETLKKPVVVISADGQAPHQAVIHAMQAAQSAGLGQISFTVETTAPPAK